MSLSQARYSLRAMRPVLPASVLLRGTSLWWMMRRMLAKSTAMAESRSSFLKRWMILVRVWATSWACTVVYAVTPCSTVESSEEMVSLSRHSPTMTISPLRLVRVRTPPAQSSTSVPMADWVMGAERSWQGMEEKSNSMGSSSVSICLAGPLGSRALFRAAASRVDLPDPMTPEMTTRPASG